MPVISAFQRLGSRGRLGVAAGLGAAAIAAGALGMLASSGGAEPSAGPTTFEAAAASGSPAPSLQGVSPDFRPPPGSADGGDRTAPVKTTGEADPDALAGARRFAAAFLDYEVGRSSGEVAKTLRATSTPALAKALRKRPPRLPADGKVPRARLLNVLAGPSDGKRKLEVSVSILRLGAASELRLTLARAKDGWRVSEVRG